MASKINKLAKVIGSVKKFVPVSMQPAAFSMVFNMQVKYAMTSGIRVEKLDTNEAKLSLKNRMRVQNHIGGIHACGMALLAESSTGIVFGMNVQDQCIPLMKSMSIDFTRRANGDLQAVASLDDDQINMIKTTDRGEVVVPVLVTDTEDKEPIKATMTWAWVPKNRK